LGKGEFAEALLGPKKILWKYARPNPSHDELRYDWDCEIIKEMVVLPKGGSKARDFTLKVRPN
jgi:hypothetical protein